MLLTENNVECRLIHLNFIQNVFFNFLSFPVIFHHLKNFNKQTMFCNVNCEIQFGVTLTYDIQTTDTVTF